MLLLLGIDLIITNALRISKPFSKYPTPPEGKRGSQPKESAHRFGIYPYNGARFAYFCMTLIGGSLKLSGAVKFRIATRSKVTARRFFPTINFVSSAPDRPITVQSFI